MESTIRYVRREDGARTAYGVMGQGPVMIIPPGFLSHLDWTLKPGEARRTFWEELAKHRTLVMYDRHGCGLSDRNRTDFTADDDMRDLYAVFGALGVDDADFFGISFGGSPSLRFAAERPECVRRLMFWGTDAGIIDLSRLPDELTSGIRARNELRHSDGEAYMRLMAAQMFPSGVEPKIFRDFVHLNRESATVAMQERLSGVRFENMSLPPTITIPALVLHGRGDQVAPFAVGEFLARKLPNAVFVPLNRDEHLPYYGDVQMALEPILQFLLDGVSDGRSRTTSPSASGTAIILFTDIVDSTPLTERMGDSAFRDASRTLEVRIREAMRAADGTPVEGKVLGDGVMAVFASAAQAIDAARRCVELSAESELRLHVGLHAGDVIREKNNVYGGAVNIASRICGLSKPGEILVSGTVRDLARTSAGVTFEDRGEQALKGIDDAVRIWTVSSR